MKKSKMKKSKMKVRKIKDDFFSLSVRAELQKAIPENKFSKFVLDYHELDKEGRQKKLVNKLRQFIKELIQLRHEKNDVQFDHQLAEMDEAIAIDRNAGEIEDKDEEPSKEYVEEKVSEGTGEAMQAVEGNEIKSESAGEEGELPNTVHESEI